MSQNRPSKPLPQPTPETRHFWEGTKAHELRIQHCTACDTVYFYPRPYCPSCFSDKTEWRVASGRGTLHTYMIHHRTFPPFEAPLIGAVVQLEEGPRMATNIVGVEPKPENLRVDMPVEVVWEDVNDEITLPMFRPVRS